MLYNCIKKKLNILIFFVFAILTFFVAINRTPFFDEAHSFFISGLNFKEILYLTRVEGHPILWYLILKPFSCAKFYPYPMLAISYCISFAMVLFFWFKSPFNTIEKTLFIFSYPVFSYFMIVARPYGLTILLIFLCTYFLNKNRPILYSFLLFFLMNTTAIGMISAFCFFTIFVYKIFKEKNISKKDFFGIFSIFLLTLLFFVVQFSFVKNPDILNKDTLVDEFLKNLFSYVFYPFLNFHFETLPKILFKSSVFCLFWMSLVVFFKKSKISLFYFLTSSFLLTFLFCKIYIGASWHYYFYFINYVVAIWLGYEKIKETKILKIFFIFVLFLLLNPYSILKDGKVYVLNTSEYPKIVKDILEFDKNNEKKYFCFDFYRSVVGILPYLKKENINVYNMQGFERSGFDALKMTFKSKRMPLNPDEFVKNLDKNKKNYLIASMIQTSDTQYPKTHYYKGEYCTIKFSLRLEDKKSEFAIYEIGAYCNEK